MIRSLLLLGLMLAPSAAARAQCESSAGGQRSVSVTLSPLAGVLCVHRVAVHEGGVCQGEPLWRADLGCNETRRMIVTDDGRLVALLAPRASRPEWEIVRLFRREGERLLVRSIRLEDLPGRPARARAVRLSLDPHELTVAVDPEVTIPVATLLTLGDAREVLRPGP